MSVLRSDHHVAFRREETIAEAALNWRVWAENEDDEDFNIVEYIETFFKPRWQGGALCIRLFTSDSTKPGDLAYVTYNPPTLHIERGVWEEARRGEPTARYMIAHELGHLVLHNADAKAFSASEDDWLKFGVRENSAEWQAHVFAEYFLLPNHQMQSLRRLKAVDVAGRCCVPVHVVHSAVDRGKRLFIYSGDPCSDCGNFTMARNGIYLKCDTCGATSGCS